MNRWYSRLADLKENIDEALPVQIVQNVQKLDPKVGFEHFEQFEQRGRPAQDRVKPWSDDEEERAAVIEYDGGAPRAWAEALARLDPNKPPGDVPPRRWLRFIDDCGRFLHGGWALGIKAFTLDSN